MNLIIKKFPDELHYKLKVQAAKDQKSMAAIIIEVVAAYLAKAGKK